MSESETYKSLAALTKARERWEESIPYVASLLPYESVKIQAKALWLLGEMELAFPLSIQEHVPAVAAFLDSGEPILRERAINALGRIAPRVFSVGRAVLGGAVSFLTRRCSRREAGIHLGFGKYRYAYA